ncbi:peptidyl-prolyl cis-trans isomerase CYP26-2, chloroplastic [Diospyros lotus]|uniref:peptidyl-prolyl cis-trans isomerase CYP26-2, chloroplastic n=1 Tax=Diospyros lotus TaxID=55363 RepID=UPI002257B801|nr:peptidyl-prolyl cis-trans isomerase CYP26-2, chloroplastic [Diospyros lotus]
MWQTPRLFQHSPQLLHPPPPPPPLLTPTQIQDFPTSQSPLNLRQHCQFSRRELAIFGSSSLLFLGPPALEPVHLSKAQAEESPANTNGEAGQEEDSKITSSPSCIDKTTTKKAFLDISVNGERVGRIVVGLYGNSAPAGAARFSDLVSGAAGISYRRKEFVKIMPNYVQHGGLRSYGVDAELAQKTGGNFEIDSLKSEWEGVNGNCRGTKNLEGSVGIIVRDPQKLPPKLKLIAKNGKLQIDEEEVGVDPNGTEFVIATKDSPELDESVLVVGRVLEGMEVVQRIGQVKTVQENTGSPYFRVAKLIGDKRAVVAERGFNRPYSKVVVSNCGLID